MTIQEERFIAHYSNADLDLVTFNGTDWLSPMPITPKTSGGWP